MSTPSFRFRQFTVWHDRCAMKVGTDGVLLGAWVHVPACSLVHVLDIGTGSGLIALMLAQRAALAQVDALDIDAEAVSQASDNFRNSPFADRLSAYHSSVQDWQMDNDKCPNGKCPNGKCPSDKCSNGTCPNGKCYDLIVSNPPFFRESLRNPDAARNAARILTRSVMPTCSRIAYACSAPRGGWRLSCPRTASQTSSPLPTARDWVCSASPESIPSPANLSDASSWS